MAERIRIQLDGQALEVEPGLSLVAALLNAGCETFRTSVRGEGRGPICGMGVCTECRVTIDGVAQRRACLEPLRAGMEVRTR